MKKDSVSWECPKCGHRHAWKWEHNMQIRGRIVIVCDKCGGETWMMLEQLGRRAWVAVWGAC